MITLAESEKLGAVRVASAGMLSLYLAVPVDPAELRGLPARADDLIAAAEGAAGGSSRVADADRGAIRQRLEARGRDWLGHTVAMFACADAGLFEVLTLPCHLPDRAVLGTRPHIRPLLAAVQRCPAYRVAVVDRVHALLFHVDGDETETVTAPAAESVRGTGFGGWDGRDSYRTQQRAEQLASRHYRDTAAMLEKAMAHGEPEPLVIGGHDEAVGRLLASLPPGLRQHFAGSFAADAGTLTAATARELAAPLVADWAGQRTEHLAEEVLATPPGDLAAAGLRECLAAVNARAVATLVVPEDGLVPGHECGTCGALFVEGGRCEDCGTAGLAVPDVIEEMVARTLENGGQVYPVPGGLSRIGARLRFGGSPHLLASEKPE